MDLEATLKALPDLKRLEKSLDVIGVMAGYATEKANINEAMLEVRTVNKWSVESIQDHCNKVMEKLGEIYQTVMDNFNAKTGEEIDTISITPFKKRYQEELAEQEKLKRGSNVVIEMAARVALAKNFTLPASSMGGKLSNGFKSALKAMKLVEDGSALSDDSPWLVEPVLQEDADSVQFLALIDKKNSAGVEALNAFMTKLKLSDKELEKKVIEALNCARLQSSMSEGIIQKVTTDYKEVEAKVVAILAVQKEVQAVSTYISGE